MRSRVAFISIALAATTLALPLLAHAASIPFFGPILDGKVIDQSCALGWGALILVINNIIRLLITITIIFIAPLVIAYSGFLLVVNSMNPGGKEQAKHMIQNLVIGLVVALAAWLIVDAIMAVLYNKQFGNWYDIITTGGQVVCIPLATDLSQAPPPSGVSTSAGGIPLAGGPQQNNRGACTASALQSTFGNYAAAMSCVSLYEDASCDPNAKSRTDLTLTGQSISIGIFQVNLSTNDLNYPACLQAAHSTTPLNCTKVFSGQLKDSQLSRVSINPGFETQYATCVQAASEVNCNLAAAKSAFDDRVTRRLDPLSAWGTTAQTNCSSLKPAVAFSPLLDLAREAALTFKSLLPL